jgi:Zn-dependent metalloprotease
VKFLKQGVCLALLGDGLSAAPVTLTASASATSSPTAATSAARDQGLVQDIRDTARGNVSLSTRAATGDLGFARVANGGDLLPGVAGDSKSAASAKADQYLAKYGGAFGAGKGELTRQSLAPDSAGGYTATYTQSYKGIPVFGAVLKAHVDDTGDLTSVNGYAAPGINLSTDVRQSKSQAATRAIEFVRSSPASARSGREAARKGLQATHNDLLVYRDGAIKGDAGTNRLVYAVEVSDGGSVREKVFVDANSGKVVNRYSMTDQALDRELREAFINDNGTPDDDTDDFVDFTTVWVEGDPFPGALNQDQQNLVVSSGESYWFFKNAFNRDSYDGNGAKRITVNNDPRIACPNANWNGITTNYCDGVTSDDVVAHEWGHAYTEYTSGLIYQWQSGALNESYSDVWGETLDLINGREDEGEGDLDAKRPVGLCSSHSPVIPLVSINSPASIKKDCVTGGFLGPTTLPAPITQNVVVALDAANPDGPTTTDGCTPWTNAAAVAGKIAMVDRGTCTFVTKAQNAKAAGVAALIIGNRDDSPIGFSDADTTLPPTVSIGLTDREAIRTALGSGPVEVTIKDAGGQRFDSFRWLVSEKSDAFGGAIRDMWVPTCYGDPGKVSDIEYKCSTDDQGGVHGNSGVPNHGYALLVDGGTYNGVTVNGIGLTKAAHIWYQAMTNYLVPVSGFADMADALDASCADLVGKQLSKLSTEPNDHAAYPFKITAADCTQVSAMARAVQLRTEPVQCNFGPQLDPNTPATCGAGTGTKSSYLADFESGLGAWTPTVESVFGGPTDIWKFTSDLPSGHKPAGSVGSAFAPLSDEGTCTGDDTDGSMVTYLTGPDIVVGAAGDVAGSARLTFDHNIQTELGFDGGTVQLSTDDGTTWDTIPVDAYLFNGPTVLATEAEGSTNPLAGEDGFTGTDGGHIVSDWGTSIVDLSSLGVALGDTIKLRFAAGRDGCGGVFGWWVDNVKVSTCVTLTASTITAAHVPEPSTYGSASSVNVSVTGTGSGTATGTVTVKEGAATLGSAPLSATGTASVPLAATLAAGAHALTVSYSAGNYADSSKAVTATVNKAASTTTASAPGTVKRKQDFDVSATVSAAGGSPTGTVQVFDGSKLLGTGTLANGHVIIHVTKNLKSGQHTLTVKYLGSTNVAASETTITVKVKKKKHHHHHH